VKAQKRQSRCLTAEHEATYVTLHGYVQSASFYFGQNCHITLRLQVSKLIDYDATTPKVHIVLSDIHTDYDVK